MGYSVSTTVLAAAASYDLTDLGALKGELGIQVGEAKNDAWLTARITEVSKAIARHCKRVFAPELLQDVIDIQQDPFPYQTPGGFRALQLSRWPVLAVVSVTQTLALNTTQALTEGTDFRVDAEAGELLRLSPFTGVVTAWEAVPVTVVYLAGYGQLQSEAQSVPASSPYTVQVDQALGFSCDWSVAYAAGGALLTRVAANPAQGQYSVEDGTYTFAAADHGAALTIAYATLDLPADLVGICLRVITDRFAAKGRDPSLIQRDTPSVGTERFWFGGAPGQKGQWPPDIEAALEDFRVPTAA